MLVVGVIFLTLAVLFGLINLKAILNNKKNSKAHRLFTRRSCLVCDISYYWLCRSR